MIVVRLLWLLLVATQALAALLETRSCKTTDVSDYKLDKTLMDVALDKDNRKLKFFMNTKVINPQNLSLQEPVIVDVNSTTNKYTTFHAQIWFQGKMILDENKRFCDMIGVKNTSEFLLSPRFDTEENGTIVLNPDLAYQAGGRLFPNTDHKRDQGLDEIYEDDIYDEKYEEFEVDEERDVPREKREDPESDMEPSGRRLDSSALSSTVNSSATPVSMFPLITGNEEPEDIDKSFASTNKTIESLYNNSTGQLVSCPLYVNDSIYIYYEVDISEQCGKIGSFTARFSVVSNDLSSNSVGCTRVYVTPVVDEHLQSAILFGSLLMVLATIVINFLTVIYSSHQESTNPFLFTASTICNEKLLKQLDATVQRIILYFQFALFTAGLNLNYPGFYQPILALLKWTALLGFSVLSRNQFFQSTERDNVYITYNTSGLNSLAYFGDYRAAGENWWNFILTLIIWICLQILAQAVYFLLKYSIGMFHGKKFVKPPTIRANFKRGCSFVLGITLNNFMMFFGYPFLILTLYLFYLSGQDENSYHPDIDTLKYDAFSRNVSYDSLFTPISYVQFYDPHSDQTQDYQVNQDSLDRIDLTDIFPNITKEDINVINDATNLNVAAAPLAVGAILFFCWLAVGFYFMFRYLITVRRWRLVMNNRISKLYTSVNTILVWAFFYHHYSPNKTYYVILDLVHLFLRLVVVSMVQSDGMAQVICLIVLEIVSLILLFVFKPFYLKITWGSSKWMIPLARVLVTILCIPFITSLNLSEDVITYTALAQMIIHGIVAVVFLIQLVLCFGRTIYSIYKHRCQLHHISKGKGNEKLNRNTSIDDFNKQFEYQPVGNLFAKDPKDISMSDLQEGEEEEEEEDEEDSYSKVKPVEISNPDFYYRSNAEYNLRNHMKRNGSFESASEIESFEKQQEFSNKRKKQNDYTTREADLIYKKYFIDDEMDPDIKQLWESRRDWYVNDKSVPSTSTLGTTATTNTSSPLSLQPVDKSEQRLQDSKHNHGLTKKLKSIIRKEQESEKGFQVSRPRPLVVKKFDSDLNRKGSSKTCRTSPSTKTFDTSSMEDSSMSSS